MSAPNARFVNKPFFEAILSEMDDCDEAAATITDAFADYESAAELPSADRSDARDEARDQMLTALGEWIAGAEKVIAMRAKIEASMDGTES